jgi:hypothetical protein
LQEPHGVTTQKTPFLVDADDCGAISGMNEWQRKIEVLAKFLPHGALSTTDPTILTQGSNPDRHGGNPATKRLTYGTARNRFYLEVK